MALTAIGEIPGQLLAGGRDMDAVINTSLAKMGMLFSASRSYVMQDEKDGKYLRNTHLWVSEQTGSAMVSWPLYDYEYDLPSLKNILTEHEVFFGNTKDMPLDLNHVLSKQGVHTFTIAPLLRDGSRIGLVGMDYCETECAIQQEFLKMVPVFANLIALALERKQFQLMRAKLAVIHESLVPLEPIFHGFQNMDPVQPKASHPTTLLGAERQIIIEALEMYNGNKLKAAKHLGLTWPSLDRRCKKLDISIRKKETRAARRAPPLPG